jgi:hypothetical protein
MFLNTPTSDIVRIFDVTTQIPIQLTDLPAWSHANYTGALTGLQINQLSACVQNPMSLYVNPLTNKVYSLQSYNVYQGGNYVSYFTYKDYTNLNAIPGSNLMPLTFFVNGTFYNRSLSNITNIRSAVWNQKVWAMISMSDNSSTYLGTTFVDISNIEYTITNYSTNEFSTIVSTQVFPGEHGIDGIGIGLIHKLDNFGTANWLSHLGGNSESKWSTNVNISNIELDNNLLYAYVAGSWCNKIQAVVDSELNGTPILSYVMNSIISQTTDTTVNSFICKMNINNGTFVWLSPTFGSNDDYFERIQYISQNSSIAIVSHFSSPVMLIYEPQQSSLTGWTNPLNTELILSNTSNISSALILLTPEGK